MGLNVITASAGSGKTYNLVMSYLKLVLSNPQRYSGILAITFTNKAATEMKVRIITRLRQLIHFEQIDDADLKKLTDELSSDIPNNVDITKQAQTVLNNILHDYSSFTISTIDSFSQRLIRSFYREMKLTSNYKVELDFDHLVSDAVTRVVANAGLNKELTDFLLKYINYNIENEENSNFEYPLINIGKLLGNENFRNVFSAQASLNITLSDYITFIDDKYAYINKLKSEIKTLADKATTLIKNNGLQPSDFYRGENGIGTFFLKTYNDPENTKINSYHLQTINDNKWYTSNCSKAIADAIDSISPKLVAYFNEINKRNEILADQLLIAENLYPLALLNEIAKEIETIKIEKNMLPIAEFNNIISNAIAQSEAPFIYERIGEKFHNFLIDEFQDTSILQWHNLIPLIDNSLATDNFNLLVGDAKQSIYRWRNGEVQQFVQLPKIYMRTDDDIWKTRENNFIKNYSQYSLPNNFRSGKALVDFNNKLYSLIKESLSKDNQLIYNSCTQTAKKNFDGYVKIISYDKNIKGVDATEFNCVKIEEIINNLTKNNKYAFQDIAILCEKKKYAKIIANYLTQDGIDIISPDSLLLNASKNVMFLVSIIRIMTGKCCDIEIYKVLEFISENYFSDKPAEQLYTDIYNMRIENNVAFPVPTEEYMTELKQIFNDLNINLDLNKLQSEQIFEIFTQLLDTFSILSANDMYINQLMNYIFQKPMSLYDFPKWFEENEQELTISSPGNINAVQIMTIHKSKGLEFPVVICPFANYNIEPRKNELLLVNAKDNNFSSETHINKYLIKYSSKLKTSKNYRFDYAEEKDKRILDCVNLLYVATTRASEQLYIITENDDRKDKESNLNKNNNDSFKINDLLAKFTKKHGNIFGELTDKIGISKEKIEIRSYTPFNIDWSEKLKISSTYKNDTKNDHSVNAEYESNEMLWGKKLHLTLSYINKKEDKDIAIKKTLAQYPLTVEEQDKINKTIDLLINNGEINKLMFDYDRVYIERDIVDSKKNNYRIDRMIEKDGKYYILDFKTGTENESNNSQVKKYCNIVKEITSAEVNGYLIYCNDIENKMICVFSTPRTGI